MIKRQYTLISNGVANMVESENLIPKYNPRELFCKSKLTFTEHF